MSAAAAPLSIGRFEAPRVERHLRLITDEEARAIVAARSGVRPRALSHALVRLAVRLLAAVVALALAIGLGALAGLALRGPAPVAGGSVTVAEGQSLWTVAAAVSPVGRDVRDVVAEIVTLNGLEDAVVEPGQELLVPAP